jgi:hypothetical protein
MMFNRSQILVLGRDGSERPWRWTTEPVYGNGLMNPPTVPGVKATPAGAFILFSDEIVATLKENLTQAQKDELQGWVERYHIDDPDPLKRPQTWHVPVWAGQDSVVVLRVPNAVWNDPTTAPPAKVKTYLQHLWREAT